MIRPGLAALGGAAVALSISAAIAEPLPCQGR